MSVQDNQFSSKVELEDWLKGRGVKDGNLVDAADTLFTSGYDMPSALLGITLEELDKIGINGPVARKLVNKLKDEYMFSSNTNRDEDYRAWLLKDMAPEEYNLLDPVARRTLRTQFEQLKDEYMFSSNTNRGKILAAGDYGPYVFSSPEKEQIRQMQQMQIQQLRLLKLVSEEVNRTRKSRLNCWERDSLRTTGSQRDPNFRKKVIKYYQRLSNSKKSVKCQILDEYVELDTARNTIIAAHIWKAETKGKELDEFGLLEEDINNARNGMFLTEGILKAFDNQQVCFLYNTLDGTLRLWVADTSIRSKEIVGSNPKKTFFDIHQKPLLCPDKKRVPFRRLLAWHARLTLELRKESIQMTNYTSEYDLSPGRAGATMNPIARAINDMVEPGEDASVSGS